MTFLPADDYAAQASYVSSQDQREPWRQRARCADPWVPMDWFFPDEDPPIGAHDLRRARLTCAQCTVRLSCLAEGLRMMSRGVWGGTTEAMRERTETLPLPERVRTLDQQFYQVATRGPWRVISADEWRELGSGEQEANGGVRLRPQGVLGT